MEELINFIIELTNALKYGQWVNKNKSFEKQMNQASLVEGEQANVLKCNIDNQLSLLLIKGNGTPAYAYFEHRKNDWYKIFILNNEKGFYCRLRDEKIETSTQSPSFYIKI